jgi:hypothetical protein
MTQKPVTPAERREALIAELMRELRAKPMTRSQAYETLDALAHSAALAIKSKNPRRCVEQVDFFVAAMDRHFRDVDMPTNFGLSLGTVEIQQIEEGSLA